MGYKDPERQREYQRLWVAARRRGFFEGRECRVCGSTDQLELDHVDPDYKVTHNIWSWSAKRREAELAKCQVLCYYCHKEKTRNAHPLRHGTSSRYNNGCRCSKCREYNRVRKADYRKRQA